MHALVRRHAFFLSQLRQAVDTYDVYPSLQPELERMLVARLEDRVGGQGAPLLRITSAARPPARPSSLPPSPCCLLLTPVPIDCSTTC